MARISNLIDGSSVDYVERSRRSVVTAMCFFIGGRNLLACRGSGVVDHVKDELFQFSLLDEGLNLPLQMEALGG